MEINCHPFGTELFTQAVRQASRAQVADPSVDQVAYLGRYAQQLGARSFIVETSYIDRHYSEEFGLYHARCMRPPPSRCQRIHLFSRVVADADLNALLERAFKSLEEKVAVEKALSEEYLGFVVVRPLPHVPVGRTVLRPLEDRMEREIFTTQRYTVHLLGLELSVKGLAFQQQDRAVGTCATTALWMALSRVARMEGARAPTSAFIAEVASRSSAAEGRSLPSRGLTIPQVTQAIRETGYAPEVLRATTGRPEYFLALLHCYLRSGLPVVLVLGDWSDEEAHAVTAVGYRLGDHRADLEADFPTRSAYIQQLYVHDDRLGPYARARLSTFTHPPVDDERASLTGLFLEIERDQGEQEGPLLVRCAVIPVYPKLRLSSQDLSLVMSQSADLGQELTGDIRAYSETFLVRSGSYLEELVLLRRRNELELPGERLTRFLRCTALSRWVCVARYWSGEHRPLFDLLYDTTDVVGHSPERVNSLMLGAVAFDARLRKGVEKLGRLLAVPVL
jgi:hypothetical protein